MEFLIKRIDGEWFDLTNGSDAFRPSKMNFNKIEGWGDGRIEVDGCPISFSNEDPGIQVVFEAEIYENKAEMIINEIKEQIEKVSGQKGEVIPLG